MLSSVDDERALRAALRKARGELGAWFLGGPTAWHMLGWGGKPTDFPDQLGENMVSIYVFAALTAAVFHLQRTGEGQEVELAMHHVATWGIGGALALYAMMRWLEPSYTTSLCAVCSSGPRAPSSRVDTCLL